jgi:hypothetical protein
MSWLRMSILAIAGLLVGAADAAASAGPNPQDACRHGGVSPAAHLASASEVAAGPIVDRTRLQINPVEHGAEMGKGALIGNATPESEQPPDRETVPQGALEPLDDPALRRALYGNYVRRNMTGVYDRGGLEFFCSNGGWHELGGRASFWRRSSPTGTAGRSTSGGRRWCC